MTAAPTPTRVIAFVPDLMDRSKVAAAAAGRVRFVGSAAELLDAAGDADLVVVDLGRPGALEVIAGIAASESIGVARRGARPRVVAFGSHVDRDLLASATSAGADQVLARSAFFGNLAAHLA